jgi:hypothetical protein
MRRFIASLVLSIAAWGLLVPTTLKATAATASACCRRNGKHHCVSTGTSGSMGISSHALPGFRAKSSNCPYRSKIAPPTGKARPQSPEVSSPQPQSTGAIAVVDYLRSDSRLFTFNSAARPTFLSNLAAVKTDPSVSLPWVL